MSNFNSKDIRKLRDITNAGMMNCKKALTKANGNIDKAIIWLKEQGLSAAAKKSDNIAAEGVINVKISQKKAIILEINSQTDFVAKNSLFKEIVKEITEHILINNLNSIEDINSSIINNQKFSDYISIQISKIGEKITLRRFGIIKSTNDEILINGYIHANNRVGVILSAECKLEDSKKAKVEKELKNIAMHIAAMSPTHLSYKDFSSKFIEEEFKGRIEKIKKENEELKRLKKPLKIIPKFITRSQLTEDILNFEENKIKEELHKQGKPEKIWDKIIPGKISKFILDNTSLDQDLSLLDQKYVMDDSITVQEYIDKISDGKAKIIEFIRFEVGEGIEKKNEDFASEVKKQIN